MNNQLQTQSSRSVQPLQLNETLPEWLHSFPSRMNQPELPTKEIAQLKEKYPNVLMLSQAFRPNLGNTLLAKYTKGDIAHNDDIPSISLVRATYGESSAREWITNHLFDLLDYTEQEIGVEDIRISEFAELLMAKYYYLNLADIMFFCAECKLGKYGKFYGVAGPSQLAEMFAKYIQERNSEIDAIERRKQQERMARQDYLINGYHEYLAKLKEKAQAGDEEAAETLRRHGE